MRCPYCGNDDTQVKDSRPTEDSSAIRRRRICPSCGGRFTTFERVQLRELTVVKKSVLFAITVSERLSVGATTRTSSTSRSMASASAPSRLATPTPPPPGVWLN